MRQPTREATRDWVEQLAFDWEVAGEARPEPVGESPPGTAPDRAGALAQEAISTIAIVR